MELAFGEVDDLRLGAAELAFELLTFQQGSAHRFVGHVPKGQPRLGDDVFVFMPSIRRIQLADVPAYLAGLPAPAMLASTTTRGVATLHLLDELHGIRRSGLERGLADQAEVVERVSRQFQLNDVSTVLLDFGDRSRIFPLAVVKEWARRFVVYIGWNLAELPAGSRADLRFAIIRSDGGRSGIEPPSFGES